MKTKASSYGDAKDMADYQRALVSFLRAGFTQFEAEAKARKVGDPGIGWMDNVLSDTSILWVAFPYEDWKAKWGGKARAHKKKVKVTIGGVTKVCILGDTMPHKANIRNGAGIDLAPGAQAAFGLKPPFMVDASWEWVD